MIATAQQCFADALLEGTRDVFETMMFMAVENCNDNYEAINEPALMSTIAFEGKFEGCLSICCGTDCAREIASNMLGTEREIELTDEQVRDAMGEAANMVLGAVKARLMDIIGNVQVSIPAVASGIELENSLSEDAEQISLTVDIDDFVVRLTLLYHEVAA